MMQTTRFDSLEVRTFPTRAAMGRAAADFAADAIRRACEAHGGARVVFACAPSQDEFLDALVTCDIDWARVDVFHMDEYVGLPATHPQSFRSYLRAHLLAKIREPREVHLICADGEPARECRHYAGLLAQAPIDLVCMGIGENGHIAFNDPPVADFHDPALVKVVELDPECLRQQVNDGCFPEIAAVPSHAITLTIPALTGAREISCVVPGLRKAAAVRATLRGGVTTACPASILRRHPRAVLHLDADAASLIGS
jgi:glucosamine-6-phosphate deaminase